MKARVALTLAGGFLATTCQIVAPDFDVQPAIVVSANDEHRNLLREVDGVLLTVTKPGGQPRDTMLVPRVSAGQVRARGALRPDEGEPGTEVRVTLRADRLALLEGSTVLDPETGWPFEAQVHVAPVATFELGEDRLLAIGNRILLSELPSLVLRDGRVFPTSDATWSSTQPAVLEIVGDQALPRLPGFARLVGVWRGQTDSFTIEVFPEGTIVLQDTSRTYYIGVADRIADRVQVQNGLVGDIGAVSVSVDDAYPWLTAEMEAPVAWADLLIDMDGSLMPEGGEVGEVVVSSASSGVADAVFAVDARRDPSAGFEQKRWDRFCIIGDSVGPEVAGYNACISVHARAWVEGGDKRVVLEVENLLGSLLDSLDTSPAFDVRGVGVAPQGLANPVEFLATRAVGAVGVVGRPGFRLLTESAFYVGAFRWESTIIGCAASQEAPSHWRTCDSRGETGHVRFDFRVADTSWALADATVTMDPYIPRRDVSNCAEWSASGWCVVALEVR